MMESRGLPPGVVGPVQGQLSLSVGNVVVRDVYLPKPRGKLFFRFKFWGDSEEVSFIANDDGTSPSKATFCIRCDAQTFLRYLGDMETLQVWLESGEHSGYIVGCASVRVADLSSTRPVWGKFPVMRKRHGKVGTIDVSLSVVVTTSATSAPDKRKKLEKLKTKRTVTSRKRSLAVDVEVGSVLELFDEFDRALARKRLRLIDVFRTFDRENRGVFDEDSLDIMLQRVIDCAVPLHHRQLCWLMIDRTNSGAMTFASFSQGLRESKMACRHVATQTGGVLPALVKVSKQAQELISHIEDAITLASSQGEIEISHMVLILRELIPSLNHKEERYLIASLVCRQPHGMVSFQDLRKALCLRPEKPRMGLEEFKRINMQEESNLAEVEGGPMSDIHDTVVQSQVGGQNQPPTGEDHGLGQSHLTQIENEWGVLPASILADRARRSAVECHVAPREIESPVPVLEGGGVLSCSNAEHAGINSVDGLIDRAQGLLRRMNESCRNSLMLEQMDKLEGPDRGAHVRPCTAQRQEPTLLQSALAKINAKRVHKVDVKHPGKENGSTRDSNSNADSSSLSDEPDVSVDVCDGCSNDSSSCGRPDLVAEDALLKSLFFSKTARKELPEHASGHGVGSADEVPKETPTTDHEPHAADIKASKAEIDRANVSSNALAPLRLVIDRVQCIEPVDPFIIVRCRSVAPSRVELGDKMPAADVLIPQPEGIAGGVALETPLVLVLEVRSKNPNNDQDNLVGIAKAPLAGAFDPLTEGTYDIWDVINDRSAGKVCASVRAPSDPNTTVDSMHLDEEPFHPSQREMAVDEFEEQEDNEKEEYCETEMVKHRLIVAIESVQGLPGLQDFQCTGIDPPKSYYLEYMFPGDGKTLATNDIPVGRVCEFMAKAVHEIPLERKCSISQYLKDNTTTSISSQSLQFQLCCRYTSGEYKPLFQADLQSEDLSDLAESSPHMDFNLEMIPCSDSLTCTQHPTIDVQVSYSLDENCTPPSWNTIQQAEASMLEIPMLEETEPVLTMRGGLEPGWDCSSAGNRAVEPIDSMVCVEILRCTGLLAAVEEAQLWLGGGTSLLGNAHQLGPHPFVTLSLLPELETLDVVVPMIQTPFQAQCFCPVYHHKREVPLKLTVESVRALAEQELSLEVWHHCSRAQAVAARLAEGKSARKGKNERRNVFLGSASSPLHQLLAKPQGIRGWLPLKSRRGEPVGAVQLAVHFSSIGEHHCHGDPGIESPIEHVPHLVEFLVPQLRNSILGPLHAPEINGQWIRVAVHIEEALFSSRHGESRPPSGPYHAEYSLPGSQGRLSTRSAQAAASGLNLSIGMGGKWRVDWHHSGQHWVKGDDCFIRAMLGFPLLVDVYRQTPRRLKKLNKEHLEKIGCAEIDLSILLKERTTGNDSHRRWLSGSYLLVDAASKHLENARVKVRALVDIMPQVDEIPEAHIWEISSKVTGIDLLNEGCPSPNDQNFEAQDATPRNGVGGPGRTATPPSDDRKPELAPQISKGEKLDGIESGEQYSSTSQSNDAGQELDDWPSADSKDPAPEERGTLGIPVLDLSAPSTPHGHRSMISCMTNTGEESVEKAETSIYQTESPNSRKEEKTVESGTPTDLNQAGDNQGTEAQEGVSDVVRKGPVQFDEAAISLLICVEGGLHLELPQGHQGVFVSFQVKEGQQKTCTQLAEAFPHSDGFAVQWDSRHEFMVSHVDDIEKISLHVWSRRKGNDEPLNATSAAPQELDFYVGCAVVDLSSLNVLKEIVGWYNIFDDDSELKGQLKASITLDDGSAVVALESDWFGPEVGNHSLAAFPQASVGFEFRVGENDNMEALQKQLAELETMATNWTKAMEEEGTTEGPSNCRLLTLSDDDNYVVCGGMVTSSDSDSLDAACPMVFTGAVSEGEEEESHDIEPSRGITSFEFPEPFAYDDDWMFEITKGGRSMPSNVQSNEVPGAWRAGGNAAVTSSQGDATSSQALHQGNSTDLENQMDEATAGNTSNPGLAARDTDLIGDEISIVRVSEDDLQSREQVTRKALFANVLPPPVSTSPIQFSDGPPAPTFRRSSEPCSSVEAFKRDDENDEGDDHRNQEHWLGSHFESSATSMGKANNQQGTSEATGGNSSNSSRECQGGHQDASQGPEGGGDENRIPQSLDCTCNLAEERDSKPTISCEARVPVVDAKPHPEYFSGAVHPPTAFPANYEPRSAPFSMIPPGMHSWGQNHMSDQAAADACDQFPSAQNISSCDQALNLSPVKLSATEQSRSHLKGTKVPYSGASSGQDFSMDTNSLLDKYRIPRQPGWWKSLLSEEARGYLEPTSNWRSNQLRPSQHLQGTEKAEGLAFVPDVGHSVPNWRDLIGKNKSQLCREGVDSSCEKARGTCVGERPAEGTSEGSKRYIDEETERIANIMSGRWK